MIKKEGRMKINHFINGFACFFAHQIYLCAPFFNKNDLCYAENENPLQRQEAIQGDWYR